MGHSVSKQEDNIYQLFILRGCSVSIASPVADPAVNKISCVINHTEFDR